MKLKYLKKLRIIISLLFFVFTGFIFLDFAIIIPISYYNTIIYLQFFPSFIKFIALPTLSAAGFIFILILTFLFGRIYCSTICPLGTLQDIITYVKRKIKKKRVYDYHKPNNILRYTILTITIISLFMGSFLVSILDPYSNFGRIFSNLVKPVLVWINNSAAGTLEKHNIYAINLVDYKLINTGVILFSTGFLVIILWLAIWRGRLYCNTICPVGSFLGLLSRFSLFKIHLKSENCISCKLCSGKCKAECIDRIDRKVDLSRCVSCFNCFDVCPEFTYKLSYFKNDIQTPQQINKSTNKQFDKGKRSFIINLSAFLLGITVLNSCQKKVNKISAKIKEKLLPVTPPGSKGLEHFTDKCTACHLCVAACPTQVIQPTLFDYGIEGVFQPKMDYFKGFCNYECTACGKVCPTGAILPLNPEKKKLVQLGTASILKDVCIVYVKFTDCGACSEHCPTKAVQMIPWEKGLFVPDMKKDICIGCGACEFACPTKPEKAIFVTGNPVHKIAQKPEIKKIKQKENNKEEFPF